MMIKHFTELAIWQNADAFAHGVFDLTDAFPHRYAFDLTNQLRRAALSVPTNIVEGRASTHTKELLQFVNIARRATREAQYLLQFSLRRKLLSAERHEALSTTSEEIHRMLNGLTRSLRRTP